MGMLQSRGKFIAAFRTGLGSLLSCRCAGSVCSKIKLLGAVRCPADVPMTACILAPDACRIVAAKLAVWLITGIAYCLGLTGSCSAGAAVRLGMTAVF